MPNISYMHSESVILVYLFELRICQFVISIRVTQIKAINCAMSNR